ncbi:MAG TPA: RNA-processing protein [Candidatus Poseidoniales archaeon]|jgi:ribosomal RNA assembly protein|nr:MAG: RNA-processing protein [Euryarchaeota archaeon]HIG03270.1 RNA-processing protein [Candidatus Poseidoniales archaeon]HIK78847.1 RNA-processing protein [Candidatus Poseidoniales archaeon]
MQPLARVPQDRIAVLIGSKGETRKMLQEASGCRHLNINSETGDVSAIWPKPGEFDAVKQLKMPDVIKAIARGMSPQNAVNLLSDDCFFQMVDLRNFVGKRSHQQRRIRGRIIGTEGKIRRIIEQHTNCEISVYGSTVVIVGDENGILLAKNAIERLASGSEHGSVINGLEKDAKRIRLENRNLDYIETTDTPMPAGFDDLVPGLADVARRRNRRLRASQVDPSDDDAVAEVLQLEEDEIITWEEE